MYIQSLSATLAASAHATSDSLAPNPPPIVPSSGAAPALSPEAPGQLQGIIIVGGKEQGPQPPPIVPTATYDVSPQAQAMRQGIIIIGGHPAELHRAVAAAAAGTVLDEPTDKLGNVEVQSLMSDFNQAETLSSNMQKKTDDTTSDLRKKLG